MKFRAAEARVYPSLGISVNAGDVVDLDTDPQAAGLVLISDTKKLVTVEEESESPDGTSKV
jgi:hypothetical protein